MICMPSSVMIAGPSGSGKTQLVNDLLTEQRVFQRTPTEIVYCYGVWQPRFNRMKKKGVRFHQGIPTPSQLGTWFRGQEGVSWSWTISWKKGGNDKRVLDIFTKDSHHRNITVFYLTQDLFSPGKFAKTINRNAHYVIAFKNPHKRRGMRNLVLQAFPDKWQGVMHVFQLCTQQPFGYLMLDLNIASDDRFRLWTHLHVREASLVVFEDTDESTEFFLPASHSECEQPVPVGFG